MRSSRRAFLAASGAMLASAGLPRALRAAAPTTAELPATRPSPRTQRYRIAACDWMMLKRQKLGAFKIARECGMEGVEIDMGGLGTRPTFDSQLGQSDVRGQFLQAARDTGMEICSLAMSAFYAQSFPTRDIDRPLQDCIQTMQQMGVKIAFLPMGVQGDLTAHPELRPVIVKRLKQIAPAAERAGVLIGVETSLDAEGDRQLLDDIGSTSIRIYFNFSNALQTGRNLCSELKTLGKDRICQIHCTDQDGVLLQDDLKIDMLKVKATLDEMDWGGWLVIERSRDAKKSRDVRYNFGANAKYLKSVFQL